MKRKAEREVREQVFDEQKQLEREEREQHFKAIQNKKQAELVAKAEQSDPYARMSLAKPNSYDYWEAYRDYEIEGQDQYTNQHIRYVNDISVLDDDFVEKVMNSIEALGQIRTDRRKH